MDEHDAAAFDLNLAAQRERRQVAIVVAAHSLDWSYAFKGRDRVRPCDVARVQDEIHPAKNLEHSIR
jgi:hypothetical protein